ncbi:MAG: tetratricopeptide repeat protein [bacterium]|nr:tetratricopeptide repeat protein [bacterium]MBU1919024.1 tetratricopeptide repeat protein [bacterium]
MSLILDALKKTETQKENPEGHTENKADATTTPTTESGKDNFDIPPLEAKASPLAAFTDPSNKKRLIILGVLVGVCVLMLVFTTFGRGIKTLFNFGKKTTPEIVTQAPVVTKQEKKETKPDEQEIIKLKKEAIALFLSGKYIESSDIYKKLINIVPDKAEIYNNYGLSLKKAGRKTEAKQAYQIALALNETYPESLNNLAAIEISEQKYNDAKKKLEIAVDVKPNYMDAHLHLAICLEKMGDLDDAIIHYEKFLELSEGKITRNIRLQVESRLAVLKEDFAKIK